MKKTDKKEVGDYKIFTLCGTNQCCPTIEFKGEEILLKDDYGGKVKLNKDQWNDLVKKAQKGPGDEGTVEDDYSEESKP